MRTRDPVSTPAGIFTSRLRVLLVQPPPRHRGQGRRLTLPEPPHSGHGSSSSSEIVFFAPWNASSSVSSVAASTSLPRLTGPKPPPPRSPRSENSYSVAPGPAWPRRKPPRSEKIVRKKSEKPPASPSWLNRTPPGRPSNGERP